MAEKVLMVALSPTMEEGNIATWKVKEGDSVKEGQVLCEVETDKASVEYESTQSGVILKITKQAGESAKVGEMVAIVGKAGEDFSSLLSSSSPAPKQAQASAPQAAPQQVAQASSASSSASGDRVKISPLAKKIAQDKGVDISSLKGSGPDGRIVKSDVENAKAGASKPAGASASSPKVEAKLEDKVIPLTGIRKVIAQRLSESMFSSPHFYLTNSVNVEKMIEAREMLNKTLKDKKVSFNAFIIKFVSEAIKRYPAVNSSWGGDKIIQFGSIDIGLAVDINGLITPIVRNTQSKGVKQIDDELQELIGKARSNTLKPVEYQGATFTISNLGSFGVEEFGAIINPPGAGILAIGMTKPTPVVEGDKVVIKPVMKVTLSADHRVIDGGLAGKFIAEFTSVVENPVKVLF